MTLLDLESMFTVSFPKLYSPSLSMNSLVSGWCLSCRRFRPCRRMSGRGYSESSPCRLLLRREPSGTSAPQELLKVFFLISFFPLKGELSALFGCRKNRCRRSCCDNKYYRKGIGGCGGLGSDFGTGNEGDGRNAVCHVPVSVLTVSVGKSVPHCPAVFLTVSGCVRHGS